MNKELYQTAIWACVGIVLIVVVVLFVGKSLTGKYTATLMYRQYEPREVCEKNGCVWNLELQQKIIRNPWHEPKAACYCDGVPLYFSLIERI